MRIYTDGACSNNGYEGSRAGYGFVVVDDNDEMLFTLSEAVPDDFEQTNNIAELLAIVETLWWLEDNCSPSQEIKVFSDSAYCINGINSWMDSWVKNGWKRAGNKSIKNLALWQAIYKFIEESGFKVEFIKVKGHADDHWNNMADRLAVEGRMKHDR